jgi:predicted dehydrogenase
MASSPLRIGIVGAGDNTRRRHIPGFRAIPGVEVAAVVNSTPQSTARVAQEFGVPRTFATWRDLVASPDVDAVLIGTWPNLHCEVTLAALEAGKHVLCEARMARNLDEARRMLAAAQRHPRLVAQVVPSPFGLACGPAIKRLIDGGLIGEVRELIVLGADDVFWDYSQPLHWRQRRDLSGNNILALGILHETALRWTPPPVRVFAQTQLFEPTRAVPAESRMAPVDVPDSLQVVTQLAGGGRGMYHFSGITLFGPGRQVHLYGSRGTIKIEFLSSGEERVSVARAGDAALQVVEVPESERGRWRVEEEFVSAIRGQEPVRLNDFATALLYMEFVEAVSLSAERNAPVSLPL